MLLRQSLFYMAANLAAAIIGFASVMTLTRLVAPADYGVFTVAVSIASVCATFFFTWLRHAVLRFQSEPGADIRMSALAGYIGTMMLYPLVLAVLLWVIKVPTDKAVVAVLFAAAIALFELGQEILRAQQRARVYATGTLIRSGLSFIFCVSAVLLGGGGIALVVAMAVGYVAAALLLAPGIWAKPRLPARRDVIVKLARYGMPITFSGVFVALTLALDRFALAALLGTDAAGIYGATADFVRQCAILPAISASLAIAPLAVANLKREDGAVTASNLGDGIELLLAVMLPAVTGLALVAPQVAAVILGPDYRAAAVEVIPVLAFAFLAHTLSQQYVQLSFGLANRPQLYVVHTGAIFLVNLVFMVPLIRKFGLPGAAWSLLVSETVGVLLGVWMARRAYALPLVPGRLLRVVAAVAVMAVVTWVSGRWLGRVDGVGLVVLVGVGGLSYGAAVYLLDVVHARRQWSRLRQLGLNLRAQRL
jgi:O-antigen/teichoic acid export membrane protein